VEQTFRSAVMNDLKIIPCAAGPGPPTSPVLARRGGGLGFPDEPRFWLDGVEIRAQPEAKRD